MSTTVPLAAPSGPSAEITDTMAFTHWQYELILYSLVVAFFALFASGVYTLSTRSEISKRYRASAVASCVITWIAALAYLALIVVWLTKWKPVTGGTAYAAKPGTIFTGLRFADWSVTVPLLTVELFAVCVLAGKKAISIRFAAMASAFLMIITGFFGVIAVGQNDASTTELVVWGVISTVFFIALYPLMLAPVKATVAKVSRPTGVSLRNAAILLLSVWGVYPLVYVIFLFADRTDAGWATTIQLAFTAADIVAKAGFGALIHKVAKLRTAEDAADSDALVPDTFSAAVSINGLPLSVPGTSFDGARPLEEREPANGHREYRRGATALLSETRPETAVSEHGRDLR